MASAPQLYQIKDLDLDQKLLIKLSVPILELSGVELAKQFYQYMLDEYPEVRPFFKESNQRDSSQPKILAFALLNYAKNIDNIAPLTGFIKQICSKHVGLQVEAKHYPIVGNCILRTMSQMLGDEVVTPVFLNAWGDAYGNLAQLLINDEFIMYQQQQWKGFRNFKVSLLKEEAKNIKSVYLEPEDGEKLISPIPGNYIVVRVAPKGVSYEQSREYSLSLPLHENQLRITVKKLDKGLVSTYIHEELKEGDTIKVAPPNGRLTYHDSPNDLLMFSGGIGITPLIPITETALSKGKKVTILYSNKGEIDRPFKSWFDQIKNKYSDQFELKEYFSNVKRLSSQEFDLFDLSSYDIYLLGPLSYMRFVKQELSSRGIDPRTIYLEYFGPVDI